ncbi:MAG: FAD-dependent monooxygenase [Variovorax sp.]
MKDLDDAQRVTVLNTIFHPSTPKITALSPLKSFALGLSAERTLTDGRIVRIGNAAQTLHPVAGQGLNLGMRDAFELVRKLARSRDVDSVLRRLEWQRAPDRWAMIAATDFLARSFTWRCPAPARRGLGLACAAGARPGQVDDRATDDVRLAMTAARLRCVSGGLTDLAGHEARRRDPRRHALVPRADGGHARSHLRPEPAPPAPSSACATALAAARRGRRPRSRHSARTSEGAAALVPVRPAASRPNLTSVPPAGAPRSLRLAAAALDFVPSTDALMAAAMMKRTGCIVIGTTGAPEAPTRLAHLQRGVRRGPLHGIDEPGQAAGGALTAARRWRPGDGRAGGLPTAAIRWGACAKRRRARRAGLPAEPGPRAGRAGAGGLGHPLRHRGQMARSTRGCCALLLDVRAGYDARAAVAGEQIVVRSIAVLAAVGAPPSAGASAHRRGGGVGGPLAMADGILQLRLRRRAGPSRRLAAAWSSRCRSTSTRGASGMTGRSGASWLGTPASRPHLVEPANEAPHQARGLCQHDPGRGSRARR